MNSPTWTLCVLTDDLASPGFEAEHGFSLWVEGGRQKILFDTGASGLFAQNASRLGVDLATADHIVISHGHYDHTGGVPQALEACPQADVFLHPGALKPRWRRLDAPPHKAIGIPTPSRKALLNLPSERLRWSSAAHAFLPSLCLSGEISRNHPGAPGGPLYEDPICTREDLFEDEQFLLLKGREGWALLSGCGHPGLPNMLYHASLLTRGEPIHSVLGGFHLGQASDETAERSLDALRRYQVQRVYPGHCTGSKAFDRFKVIFGERAMELRSGLVLTF